jgi:hypothetical protein
VCLKLLLYEFFFDAWEREKKSEGQQRFDERLREKELWCSVINSHDHLWPKR